MNNEEKILEVLSQIQAEQKEMRADITALKESQSAMQTDIGGMKGDIISIKDDIVSMKGDITGLKEIQQKQGETISAMQATLTRVAVTQENIVIPQIKLLAEGHDMLLQKLARKERVEALEDDVALLKTVIKSMSQRITELEKAQ